MHQNPSNAIMVLGHEQGTVSMWSPNLNQPLVKMLCHTGPIKSLSVSIDGKYLVTAGLDSYVSIWDLRNTYQKLYSHPVPSAPSSVSISQKSLIAIGFGSKVHVWKDPFTLSSSPFPLYLQHQIPDGSFIHDLKFCPFEDILGIGHSLGFESVLIPGSGSPTYDSLESNPFQTKKQRQESQVKSLLEKIPWDTIAISSDNVIGAVSNEKEQVLAGDPKFISKKKRTGGKRHLKKQQNIIDEKRQSKESYLKSTDNSKASTYQPTAHKTALDRFMDP